MHLSLPVASAAVVRSQVVILLLFFPCLLLLPLFVFLCVWLFYAVLSVFVSLAITSLIKKQLWLLYLCCHAAEHKRIPDG